ncbi:MAG TPA: PAS domain S-box protein [Geobacteraceae bacterium]|nr:PAS domain S-box protein [Geobacteraceae bacterium]
MNSGTPRSPEDTYYRALFESSMDAVFLTVPDGTIVAANPAACRMFGMSEKEICAVGREGLIDPADPNHQKFFEERKLTGKAYGELLYRRKDGSSFIGDATSVIVDGGASAFVIVRDITQKKESEKALRFTQFAIDHAFVEVFLLTENMRIIYANDAACRALGYTREELTRMSVSDIDPWFPSPNDPEHSVRWKEFRETKHVGFETFHLTRDGRVYPVEIQSNYLEFEGKEYSCAFSLDITERKRAEEAIHQSEEKFRVLCETSPAAIVLHQGEKFVYANPATTRISGYSESELLGMNFWDWSNEECRDTVRERGQARLRGESVPLQYEYRLTTKSGVEKWVIISAGNIQYQGKQAVISTLLDITEAKRAEERISAALAEKEVLLKEVHHRVKNNLQIICSLLDLQSDSIPDEQSRSYFRENQDRILSMALVHERLYKSNDFTSVGFEEYIRDLCTHLFDCYLADPGHIILKVDAGGLSIAVDRAIPWGLIINELVSNALKHAFPDNCAGEISIRFHEDGDDGLILTVADTGVGMPPDLDFKNTGTLGLQLVNMLARQLNGQISMEGTTGTGFTIRARRNCPGNT